MSNLLLKISKTFILFSVFAVASYGQEATTKLTFEKIFEAIQKNDPHLSQRKAEVVAAEAKLQATGSAFWPKFGVESKYETFESDFEKVKGATSHLFLDWNLFRGYQDYSVKKIAQNDLQIQKNELARYEANLKWEALSVFQKTASLQNILKLYDDALLTNQKFLETVRARKSAGLISEADLYEFDLYENELRLQRSDYESQFDEVMTELKALSNLRELKGLVSNVQPKKVVLSFEDIKTHLASTESVLQSYRIQIDSAESKKYEALGKMLPEVNLQLTYGSLGIRDTEVSPESAFMIQARWELFSGFESSSSYKVAVTEKAEAQAHLNQQEIHNLSRAEQLKKRLDIIWSRFEIEDQNRVKADKYFKAVQSEYRRGVKNSADLKSAHSTVLANEVSVLLLKAEYFEIRSELQQILGYEIKEQK